MWLRLGGYVFAASLAATSMEIKKLGIQSFRCTWCDHYLLPIGKVSVTVEVHTMHKY